MCKPPKRLGPRGGMLVEARPFLDYAPHVMIGPGLALLLTVLAFQLVGEGLDALLRKGEQE